MRRRAAVVLAAAAVLCLCGTRPAPINAHAHDLDDQPDEPPIGSPESEDLPVSAESTMPSNDDAREAARQLAEDAVTLEVDPNTPPSIPELELIAFNIEFAHPVILSKLVDWAYDWVVHNRGYGDAHLRARDLPDFLHRTLNPADEDIDDYERSLLFDAADRLREEQGLPEPDTIVYRGFLARGSPLRFLRELAHRMHHNRRQRRLMTAHDL